jgi:hypothetical protein
MFDYLQHSLIHLGAARAGARMNEGGRGSVLGDRQAKAGGKNRGRARPLVFAPPGFLSQRPTRKFF